MNELDRSKLAKICALFSSDKGGEVLAAARRAQALVSKSGLSWAAVFEVAPQDKSAVEVDEVLRAKVKLCLSHPEHLYGTEPDFLQTVRKWVASGGVPSEKQMAWLERIVQRIEVLEGDDE